MLNITISGKIASGKTTMAFALAEFLRTKGFTGVQVDDLDDDQRVNTDMSGIRDRGVVIRTVQKPRVDVPVEDSDTVTITRAAWENMRARANAPGAIARRRLDRQPNQECKHERTFTAALGANFFQKGSIAGRPGGFDGGTHESSGFVSFKGCRDCGKVIVEA